MSEVRQCPLAGDCSYAAICSTGDASMIRSAIVSSPEMQLLGPDLGVDELKFLVTPVLEAWGSDPCVKERVRALKELQFRSDISHVTVTLGTSVLDRVDQLLGVK